MLKALCLWLGLCNTISGQASIIDGDSLIVDGYHIRLQGLDAEEMNEPHGPMAKRALVELLRGHSVACRLTGDRSYRRRVAVCTVNGRDIAEMMIASGHALDCARYSHGAYRRFESEGIRAVLRQKPYCQ